jgi:lipopolysaccharide/colanic/teichoic acid biosynthesis glycosyltransferase
MSDPAVADTVTRRTLGAPGSPRSVVELAGARPHGSNGQFDNRANGAGTVGTTSGRVEHVHVRETTLPTDRRSWRVKRAFDILVSGVCLALLSPVLLVAAIGVRLTSRGPIIFRQPRVGVGGHVFTMYKFRTYPVDHVDDKFSREHDECPLVWGRFLRRTSIDELPQLLNVLKGDMSLVGPRPERPHFAGPLSDEVPEYQQRHRVPGGITGAAQVQGLWGNSSIEDRVRVDNGYIEEWSFRRDLKILARTPVAMLRKGRPPTR